MSALADHLDGYLALRRSLGYKLGRPGQMLRRFVSYLEAAGATAITTEHALAWATEPAGADPTYWRARLTAARGFARYLAPLVPGTEVPPAGLLPGPVSRRAVPYLYSGTEVTALMTAVNVAATFIAFKLIDRAGRRPLAMAGFTGMAISALGAAGGLAFLGGLTRVVFVIVALSLFIASFAAGVGGTGWLIQGEVFPTQVRGQAAAIAAMVDWIANFALIEVFPSWESGVGLAWVLVSFAALCVVGVLFVRTWLPETKGRSVDEIIDLFERHATNDNG